ncbi:MAG: S8 family serine peptidase, partial [Bacteroidota bacterium]
LDDDNNGYIDDYRGWDTGSNSDGVYDGGGHGTPVAGIVGAKGNNGLGVAGVNWDVKLMIVQGGTGVESEVLQAYSYPLDMRRRYNETNGAEGAFVVSTNASWGVDFGQPEDSPLWCAFYDTLGVHGILNCGATANIGLDVDVDGDLPTGCASDYLISVTNMNRNDVKVGGAAWGLESVDLGAFGAETWTAAFGGGYGPFGGTSGATPHVTGTIALLYSLSCPGFIDLAKSDPGAAALLAKEVILLGADPNASLEGITVTGGRLNVANAMNLLLPACGGCLPPLRSEAVVQVDTQATLIWTVLDSLARVDLRWRAIGDTLWSQVDSVQSPYLLEGLTGCTDYEYQFRADCDTTISDFSRSFQFLSEGCCRNPSAVELRLSTDTTASLIWNSVFAAQAYQVQYRRIDEPTGWATINTEDTTAALIALEACGTYEWRYRTICGVEEVNFSEPVTFFTNGCGPCTDLEYCPTREVSVIDEWVGFVKVGELENTSGAGENGYTDFTRNGPTTELTIGGAYDVELHPAFSGQLFAEGWTIWLDLNQDGDFEDDGERLFNSPGTSADPVEGDVMIPVSALPGFTRMRVIMQFNGIPQDPCLLGGSNFGEAEDYCLTLVAPDACTPPTTIGG